MTQKNDNKTQEAHKLTTDDSLWKGFKNGIFHQGVGHLDLYVIFLQVL
jgi:hypothetical protein